MNNTDIKKDSYSLSVKDFNTEKRPTWCKGCGNFGIWNAVKRAFVENKLYPHQVLVVYGIGCSGNGANFINTYSFHALHGRTLPVATGAKLANHKLKVLAMGGDGDGAGIGANHFIHTSRRNLDMTYIMHDNRIYGLTTGQTSPTSRKGFKSKSTPAGVLEEPVNPVLLALTNGASFVARGFSLEIDQLSNIIVQAIKHKGFSFIDVLQPCVTFNKIDTYEYYQERTYKLEDSDHDINDLDGAIRRSMDVKKIPIGIFFKETKPTYDQEAKPLERKPLIDHVIDNIDINNLISKFKSSDDSEDEE